MAAPSHNDDADAPAGLLQSIRSRFFDVKPSEIPKALGLSFYFFLVIAVFWILKPLKRGLLINYFGEQPINLAGWVLGGPEAEQLGKVLNMLVAYVIVVIFTFLAQRVARHHLVMIFCAAFGTLFLVFASGIETLGQFGVWSFYVLGDIWTTVMVATFWALTNDLNTSDEARRLYGIIGLGGVVGGFAGATVVSTFVEGVGRAPLLIGCLVPLALIAILVTWIQHRETAADAASASDSSAFGSQAAAASTGGNAVIEGARLVLQSRYLLGIATLLALYEVVSNIVDFQLANVVAESIEGSLEKDAFFGLIGQLTGVVSIVVQLLLTTYVMNRLGVKIALLFLPVAILFGSVGFLFVPTLALAAYLSVSDNALNYSINQSAREALYTPTSKDAKYKAKAFIDMFVQRAAKVVAVGLNLGLAALGSGSVRWLSIVVLLVIGAWIMVIRFLGRRFKEEESAQPQPVS